jgi:hypothetical protein
MVCLLWRSPPAFPPSTIPAPATWGRTTPAHRSSCRSSEGGAERTRARESGGASVLRSSCRASEAGRARERCRTSGAKGGRAPGRSRRGRSHRSPSPAAQPPVGRRRFQGRPRPPPGAAVRLSPPTADPRADAPRDGRLFAASGRALSYVTTGTGTPARGGSEERGGTGRASPLCSANCPPRRHFTLALAVPDP